MKTLRVKPQPRRNAYAECEKWRARAEKAEAALEDVNERLDSLRYQPNDYDFDKWDREALLRYIKALDPLSRQMDQDKMDLRRELDAALARVKELERSLDLSVGAMVEKVQQARIAELEEALRDMEEPLGQIIANADDDKRWDEALKNNLDGAGEAAQEALARVRAVLERE